MYQRCHACAWRCGVDRLANEHGRCGLTTGARVARESVSTGEEGDLSPSHLVYLAGCSFRCAFCISHGMVEAPHKVPVLGTLALAERVSLRRDEGARFLNVLGGDPSVNVLEMLQLVEHVPPGHRLVWNSNFFHSDETRQLLDGVVDVWLADFKFGQDACARQLAGVENYLSVVTGNLLAAASSGARLVVRHLLMPGHVECCARPVAAWLQQNLRGVEVGLTTAFLPLHRAGEHPELLEPLDTEAVASELRREFGLRGVAGMPAAAPTSGGGYQGTLFVAQDGSITLMDPGAGVADWWNA